MSYLSAGAWGAVHGPPFVRRLQDTERPPVLAGLLLVSVLALASCVGVGVFALTIDPDRRPAVTSVIAGGFLLVGAGALTTTAETVTRWWWRGRRSGRPVVRPGPSGAASTAVLRSRAALVAPWTSGLAGTAWCVVMAAAAPVPSWLRVGFALLAVAVSTRLWALASGRAVAGGVYLTREAIELRWGVETTTVPWSELEQVYPGGSVGQETMRIDPTPGSLTRRSFPVQMPVEVVDRARGRVVGLPSGYLALEPAHLWAFVDLVVRSPHLREHLGTAWSLEWHVHPDRPR